MGTKRTGAQRSLCICTASAKQLRSVASSPRACTDLDAAKCYSHIDKFLFKDTKLCNQTVEGGIGYVIAIYTFRGLVCFLIQAYKVAKYTLS
jgi:hypothetical protein